MANEATALDLAPPPTDLHHESHDGLIELIQRYAGTHGYAVVKRRTKHTKKGVAKTTWLYCDRGRVVGGAARSRAGGVAT